MRTRTVVLIASALLAGEALADRQQKDLNLQNAFRDMAEDCQRAVDGEPGYRFPKADANTLERCYGEKVRRSFDEARSERNISPIFYGTYVQISDFSYGRDRHRMLKAAMEAEPKLAFVAYEAALNGRLSPVKAFEVASRILPGQHERFARHSIEHGADPGRVLSATAAGNK